MGVAGLWRSEGRVPHVRSVGERLFDFANKWLKQQER